MMRVNLKGTPMLKNLVALAFAGALLSAGAQNQVQRGAKAPSPQTTAQAKARAADDLTARLQARAIAEAAARSAAVPQAAKPGTEPVPSAVAASTVAPVMAWPVQPPVAQAPESMPPQPARTQAQPPMSPGHAVSPGSAVPSVAAPLSPVTSASAAPQDPDTSDAVSQELAIAQKIHQGLMPCELGASVRIQADAAAPGFFHVQGKGFRYRMYPVRTSTGALRLEDKKAGAVWLQLANKSMLMDQKKGRRMADECAHPEQVAYGQSMKTNPPPSLFDKTGMGSND